MKNFAKTLTITLLALYSIVSFVSFDLTTLFDCHGGFRAIFLIIALFISAIVESGFTTNK